MEQTQFSRRQQMDRFMAFTVTTLLGGMLAMGVAYAQGADGTGGRGGRGFGGPGGFGPGGGLPVRALNLTEAQQEQMRTLARQHRDQNKVVIDRVRSAMQAHQQATLVVPLNEPLIRSTSQVLAEAQADMAVERARLHAEFFELLTPEQQARATKLQAERAARRSR
jgi:Spy/CpxP family protein refolding chaperone